MYFQEDYVELAKDTEKLIKEIEKFKTDNEELKVIKSILKEMAKHQSCLVDGLALARGVDLDEY